MRGINTVALGGNMTRDAELVEFESGGCKLSFSLAVNESKKNRETGEWEDYPNYVDCVMFGKRAAAISGYMRKGTYVSLQGHLHQQRWRDRDDNPKQKIEVIVDELHFENKAKQRSDYDEYAEDVNASYPDAVPDSIYDEDIPF